MWVRVSTALDGSVFSLLFVFLDSLLSQRMTVMGGNMIFPLNAKLLIGGI
jgi:hypothetical protein